MNRGIVSTGSTEATKAACDILEAGGNAFDAAVCSVFTSMTSEYALTGVGGGGAMLLFTPQTGPVVFDFFVNTPYNDGKKELDFFDSTVDFGDSKQVFHIGKGAAAVPGTLLGLLEVHKKFGILPLDIILEPAINLAKNGSKLNKQQAYIFQLLESIFLHTDEGRKLFAPRGKLLGEGDLFMNPDFASFLENIGRYGSNFFYNGEISNLISETFKNGGLINQEALKKYKVYVRKPIHTYFKGADVFSNPAPSLGGSLIIFLLKLIEQSNIKNNSFEEIYKAMCITNYARHKICIDPNEEFEVNKLFEEKIFSNYLNKYNNLNKNEIIDNSKNDLGSTTHVSIIDSNMNCASITTTNGEGCGYILKNTGIMFNNMLGEEDLNPLGFHKWRKTQRLPSMISPTIILKNKTPYLILGSGGSNRIRSALVQVINNIISKKMNLHDAVVAPRMHIEGNILNYEPKFNIYREKIHSDMKLNAFETKNLFFGGVNIVSDVDGFSDPRRGGKSKIV
tara:strand:+ start:1883 stop:3406 length:1524 start_codon:yes stop_codon:yes gene_type:complete